jgi:hypothetical protein
MRPERISLFLAGCCTSGVDDDVYAVEQVEARSWADVQRERKG